MGRGRPKIDRVGESKLNSHGSEMTIIKYNSKRDIIVRFVDGYTTNSNYGNFELGNIKSPYDKIIYNKGYFGEGSYTSKKNHKYTIQYQYWYNLLRRCYDEKALKNRPTYKGCKVCDEWHNFQNFAKWFDENIYTIDDEVMCLDKDILVKGNKLYSPNTCIFVPQRINVLFTKRQNYRGDYPIGVRLDKRYNKFEANCSIIKNNKAKQKFLGYYNTSKEAFYKYKKVKENYIKEVADEYKDKIPNKLYEALYKYEVEITD